MLGCGRTQCFPGEAASFRQYLGKCVITLTSRSNHAWVECKSTVHMIAVAYIYNIYN